ncbi:MAG: uroporphyrinogen decarboxylase [Treponema sp.]|jgi:uroporphyrinogen decarboxylase|nr:uroporphyrinogen decarboxylase [Treponema sp.]
MSKRDLVLRALRGEQTERVPVGFWFHFLADELRSDGLADPAYIDANLAGHRKFIDAFKPDMVKIMSDGFFCYPNEAFARAQNAKELARTRPIGARSPWIEKQVELVKRVTEHGKGEMMMFYNVFSPATIFKFLRHDSPVPGETALADCITGDREAAAGALMAAAEDFAVLAGRVITEGGADGVYFSTQDAGDSRLDAALQDAVIRPADYAVLEAAREAGGANMLHVCGYEGHRNDLRRYTDYPVQAVNWAVNVEGVPLGRGKALFGGKPVIGGFDNTAQGVLYRGSRAEIEVETARILAEAGTTGVILGADCTIPRDTSLERLEWVRQCAHCQ